MFEPKNDDKLENIISLNPLNNGAVFERRRRSRRNVKIVLIPLITGQCSNRHLALTRHDTIGLNPLNNGAVFERGMCGRATVLSRLNPLNNGAVFEPLAIFISL